MVTMNSCGSLKQTSFGLLPEYLATPKGIQTKFIELAKKIGDISEHQAQQLRERYQHVLPELSFNKPPTRDELFKTYEYLYSKIKSCVERSRKSGKRILILVGEEHVNRKCLLLEKMILSISKQLGVSDLLTELCCSREIYQHEKSAQLWPPVEANAGFLYSFAKRQLGMEIRPCDPLHAALSATKEDRSLAMNGAILQVNKNCVCVVGANHIRHIAEDSRIKEKYELIEINVAQERVSGNPHMLLPQEMTMQVMEMAPIKKGSLIYRIGQWVKRNLVLGQGSCCRYHRR